MDRLVKLLLLIVLVGNSCVSKTDKKDKVNFKSTTSAYADNLELSQSGKLKDPQEESTNEIDNKEDCIFDRKTQTDDFIKDVPEFDNYKWNDTTKIATIALKNGEIIYAQRGGCNHFGISGKWMQKNKNHSIKDVEHWLNQGKWISKRIMDETDYELLNKMVDQKSYELSSENGRLYFDFIGHNFPEWYLTVDWEFENGLDIVIIETGYYFN